MDNTKCEKCGTPLISYKQGNCCGMKCPKCGWGWATTTFEPIELDESIYVVNIDAIINPSTEELKTMSKLLNVNYLTANKLLTTGKASFEGKAVEIKEKLKYLQKLGITFRISPNFKYEA